ncbi:hypothetical protein A3C23_01220 [Candidatus Roizmanbacteria bacterium RIFCSPHIGHO2_02_FULL_37_13b]|uniref:Uncharacterized protein n=1 Tax=Candidatus Roizmanbacteria bacterium RIFCSPLOWO2_02_FULL_36_11 TaxID=1802071 RepID=A0A1F7JHF1_9BACT|nr:MAG: hypothetical protein A3C23_01220 [Candidatus Roizmanbacteria bacterium RIFCSPHIGHO2_02_FULL_37_13b]OGK55040.1 MAG: hypothetical protein A3H78_01015 [Candidatus Roizmanbacteria bacterium RIFCSPLOWO2_02_FULL_36_11]
MRYVNIFFEAVKIVFDRKRYLIGTIILTLILLYIIISIPVMVVPGNDIKFQLSIMPKVDLLIIILISLVTATSLMFNLYLLKQSDNNHSDTFGTMTTSGLAGITSSFFGTVTCLACATTILGILGVGTVAFIYQYRPILATVSLAILMMSLHLTSKKVLNLCDSCHVKN